MAFSLLPFARYRVSGHSMEPIINADDLILVNKWATPKVGDVVAFEHEGKALVKRVISIKNSRFNLEGDNKSDSLKIKPIKKDKIIGKMIL